MFVRHSCFDMPHVTLSLLMNYCLFQVFFSSMPPTRRSNRVAFSTAPGSQRNDRQQARATRRRSRSTRGESSQTATNITSVALAMSLPTPTARQAALPEDLITTLVSSVTTAVA